MSTQDRMGSAHFVDVEQDRFRHHANLSKSSEGGLGDLLRNQRARLRGAAASARLGLATLPTDGDTVTIDGHVFEFDTATPPVASVSTRTAVYRGVSAAAARANLVTAINDGEDADEDVVTPGSTAFVRPIVADVPTGYSGVRVRFADEQGGTAIMARAMSSVAVSTTMADASWNVANLNVCPTSATRKSGTAILALTAQPSDAETVVIDGHTFQAQSEDPPTPSDAAYTGFQIGDTLRETVANLVAAINGGGTTNTVVEGSTAFSSKVVARQIDGDGYPGGSIMLSAAVVQGGEPLDGRVCPAIVVSEGLSDGSDVWTNLTVGEGGLDLRYQNLTITKIRITDAMLTAGAVWIELPFTPLVIDWTCVHNNAPVDTSDTVEIDGDAVKITLLGGTADYDVDNLAADDYVVIRALG